MEVLGIYARLVMGLIYSLRPTFQTHSNVVFMPWQELLIHAFSLGPFEESSFSNGAAVEISLLAEKTNTD